MSSQKASARAAATAAILTLLFAAGACAAAPAQVIHVKLQDPSADPSVKRMEIVLDRHTVKAGRVTLEAVNESKSLVHEVLVLHDPGKKPLPYDAANAEVNENKIHSLGEVGDLPPGHSGKLTLNLKPGKYLLFCNESGHYADGMKTELTVTR
ncbi:MAG: cupredoxin domain-containing protein [Candidatus Levyibacteriota bacterium]